VTALGASALEEQTSCRLAAGACFCHILWAWASPATPLILDLSNSSGRRQSARGLKQQPLRDAQRTCLAPRTGGGRTEAAVRNGTARRWAFASAGAAGVTWKMLLPLSAAISSRRRGGGFKLAAPPELKLPSLRRSVISAYMPSPLLYAGAASMDRLLPYRCVSSIARLALFNAFPKSAS